MKRGWALSNPTRMLDALKTQEREIRALTPEEVERLLLACRPPLPDDSSQLDLTSVQPAVAILVFAGIRPEELMRLTWKTYLSRMALLLSGLQLPKQVEQGM